MPIPINGKATLNFFAHVRIISIILPRFSLNARALVGYINLDSNQVWLNLINQFHEILVKSFFMRSNPVFRIHSIGLLYVKNFWALIKCKEKKNWECFFFVISGFKCDFTVKFLPSQKSSIIHVLQKTEIVMLCNQIRPNCCKKLTLPCGSY